MSKTDSDCRTITRKVAGPFASREAAEERTDCYDMLPVCARFTVVHRDHLKDFI